ncbi:MAG: DUF21 domain-containing protein, partial [Ignavibacteriales bacterium]|nr:DUF21 domain-containing protein [Ignavibacteriales bacterium]
MELLLLYLFVAIFFSFLCSILEATILSVTPSYIAVKRREGTAAGASLDKLKKNIDRPLAAILTLNTFSHTVGAAGVGAQAQEIWGNEYLSVVSAVLTILILVFSEIIPKTLGAEYWRSLAPATSFILRWLIIALYPFVVFSQWITKWMKKRGEKTEFTRADYRAIAELGAESGELAEAEATIIKNLLALGAVPVGDVLTPRTVVLAAPENDTLESFIRRHPDCPFSRIPLYLENPDDVTGYALKDEIMETALDGGGERPLKSIKRQIEVVYENLSLLRLFKLFLEKNAHIAVVVDEYGGMAGVVT